MAGAMRKMAVYLGLVEDEAYDDYDEYDEYDERRPAKHEREAEQTRALHPVRDDEVASTSDRHHGSGHSAGHSTGHSAGHADVPSAHAADYRITTLHPRAYNDARAIGEAFRENTPVIMNLTEMDDTDAKRIVDFSAGLVFGRRGTIERVTQKVFLLSPANVVVTAEQKQRLAEGGFFNQS